MYFETKLNKAIKPFFKRYYQFTLILICFFAPLGEAYGQKTNTVTVEAGNTLKVTDDKFCLSCAKNNPNYDMTDIKYPNIFSPNSKYSIKTQNAKNYIKFYLTETAKKRNDINAFQAKVLLNIEMLDATGDIKTVNKDLTISYDPKPNKRHKPIEVLKFHGQHHIDLEVLDVRYPNNTPSIIKRNLQVQAGIDVSNTRLISEMQHKVKCGDYYIYEVYSKPHFPVKINYKTGNFSASEKYIEFEWVGEQVWEGYQVEWTYVNNVQRGSGQNKPLNSVDLTLDFSDAQRVFTSNNRIKIRNTFKSGYVAMRARGYTYKTIDRKQKVFGQWSSNYLDNSQSRFERTKTIKVEDIKKDTIPNLFCNNDYYVYPFQIVNVTPDKSFEDSLNYQYTANYFKGNQNNEKVAYYDGFMKTRQTVSDMATKDLATVSETYYNHQGRPSLQSLPAPSQGDSLNFRDHFNLSKGAQKPYSRKNFDEKSSGGSQSIADPMSPTSGAAKYYSGNFLQSRVDSFVPKSEGYPFSQVTFKNDKTGRIKKSGQVGKELQVGSNHATKKMYGTPTAEELDRLFGNQVGPSENYRKVVINDPNGQISVKYKDPSGNTIATGLTGERPPDRNYLERIPSADSTDYLKSNLATNNYVKRKNSSVNLRKRLTVTTKSTYEFSYNFHPPKHQITLCDSSTICLDLPYDFRFSVSGPDDRVLLSKKIGNKFQTDNQCSNKSYLFDTSIFLPVGAYTIKKQVSLKEQAINQHVASLMDTICLADNLDSFIQREKSRLAYENCPCDTCAPERNSNVSFCEVVYGQMLADVSPGGQYMGYQRTQSGQIKPGKFSLLNKSNKIPGVRAGGTNHWQSNALTYRDQNGNIDSVWVDNQKVLPQDLTRRQFLARWKPSWAKALVKFHPEWCLYKQACQSTNIGKFSHQLRSIDTFSKANQKDYIKANQTGYSPDLLDEDPLFKTGGLNGNHKSQLNAKLNHFPKPSSQYTLKEMALLSLYDLNNQNDTTITNFLDTVQFGGYRANEEWNRYSTFYLSARQEFFQKFIDSHRCFNRDSSVYKDFTLRFQGVQEMLDINDPTDTTKLKQKVKDSLQNRCDRTCSFKADKWMEKLSACAFNNNPALDSATAYDSLKKALVAVCKTGCDVNNPWGAKTLPADTSSEYGHQSFKDALTSILGQSAINRNCNTLIIRTPQRYNHSYFRQKGGQKVTDSCLCNKIAGIDNYGVNRNTSALGEDLQDLLNTIESNNNRSLRGFDSLRMDTAPYYNSYMDTIRYFAFPNSYNAQKHWYSSSVNVNTYTGLFYNSGGDSAKFTLQLSDTLERVYYDSVGEAVNLRPTGICGKSNSFKVNFLSVDITVTGQTNFGSIGETTPYATQATLNELQAEFGIDVSKAKATKMLKKCLCDSVQINSLDLAKVKIPGCTGCATCADVKHYDTSFSQKFSNMPGNDSSNFTEMYVSYMNGRLDNNLSYEDYQEFLHKCDTTAQSGSLKLCFQELGQLDSVRTLSCEERLDSIARVKARKGFRAYKDSIRSKLKRDFMEAGLPADQNAYKFDTLTARYKLNEYHYTLYYYDLANNLVKTVPPKGVNPIQDPQRLDNVSKIRRQIQDGAATFQDKIYPNHTMESKYQYNSLGKVVWQKTPDEGRQKFWYDIAGRLVASQKARYLDTNFYNYTRFDETGRILENGKLAAKDPLDFTTALEPAKFDAWLKAGKRSSIEQIIYDSSYWAGQASPFNSEQSRHLNGRIASILKKPGSGSNYTYATHYSYDPHGNVKTLVQDFQPLLELDQEPYFSLDYEYNLLSGNVEQLTYQEGEPDQFMHKYYYDEDNRLTGVHTSKYGVIWQNDASYDYYKHGPLARKELGEIEVQGLDYAYTLQGWLKSINAVCLDSAQKDIGRDGDITYASNPNMYFARDVFGSQLHYYNGDYIPSGGRDNFLYTGSGTKFSSDTIGLYNGNISGEITNSTKYKALNRTYLYDQLYRLTRTTTNTCTYPCGGGPTFSNPLPSYCDKTIMDVNYDPNGNITSLTRFGGLNAPFSNLKSMDSLTYHYQPNSNQLLHVNDKVGPQQYKQDIDDQQNGNYSYDVGGNLTADQSAGIDTIIWNAFGKVSRVERVDTSMRPDLKFEYGPNNRRTAKIKLYDSGRKRYRYYVRDQSGKLMASYIRTQDTQSSDTSVYPYLYETFRKANQVIYGQERVGIYRSFDTIKYAEGIRFLDTTYINKRNSKPHFIDTLRAVLSDSAYRSFMALDTLWQADSVRSSLLTALLRKSRGQNFMLNNHDSLHFLCNNPVIKKYFHENIRLFAMYLNNVHEKRPEDLLDGLYSLYSSDVQLYDGLFDKDGYYIDSLVYHHISYFKTIADSSALDISSCNNDKSCILKKVKNEDWMHLPYWVNRFVPKDTLDKVILDDQDVSNSLYVVATIFSDGEKLFKNHLNETWCQKWNNALTWFGGYLRSILGSYPDKQKLFDTLYHQGPEQGDEFRRVATRHALPTVRYNIEVNLPLSFLKKQARAYDSTAYQETWDRLKVPRTKWVFNKQDSTYAVPDTHRFCLERGRRQYELTNHTGDVLATITDRKIPVDSDPDSLVDFYRADLITADDYYPFGMPMPSRHWQADSLDQYRFGFQGMRKGNQLYGDGNLYETPFRNYDPRLGRWLSPDPIQHPWQGSYAAFNNNPIYFVDPMGLEGDENDGSGDGDDEIIEGGFYSGPVTVTPDEEGNYNNGKMPMTGKSPEEILSEVQPVNPAPTIDDLNHVDIFEPTSEKVSRKQFNRDFNFFIRNASDETIGELISRDSRLPLRLKMRAMRITVREGQTEFIHGAADVISGGSSATGLALTAGGTALMLTPFPGARPVGVSMISYGGTFGTVASSVDGTQNLMKGNYTKAVVNGASLGLSKGSTEVISRSYKSGMINYHESYLLDGGSAIGQSYGFEQGKTYLLPRR